MFEINKNFIGVKLKELRNSANLTQKEVSNAISISQSTLSMYEGGYRVPSDSVKLKLACLYGTSVQSIFFDNKLHL